MEWRKHIRLVLAALIVGQTYNQATAEELKVYDTVLNFQLPEAWHQAASDELGGMFSAEYLPQDQRLADWNNLVCVQGFHGMGHKIAPQAFFETFTDKYRAICQGELIYEPLGPINQAAKDNPGFQAILGCSRMPDMHPHGDASPRGEIGYYAVMGGSDDLLLMHKSMRGVDFSAANAPLNRGNYREFIASLQPIKLN